ncbi:MAG: 6-phosphogluconolactonase [Chromatiales bacterium]|nr:6-phosphogluconolactonase [Chromatiales bacterium]
MQITPQVFTTPEAVATAAADLIIAAAAEAIHERGAFHMVLAGGSTPARCYQLLTQHATSWQQWHLYFGDERCLPPEHPERNSRMAAETLTNKVPIPTHQVHPIPAHLGAEQAATSYATLIEAILPFDLILLGMGEDGHTASLFPDHQHPAEKSVVAVSDAPKPPPERVSLNYTALNRCRQLLLLVTGAGKRQALQQWRDGTPLPVAQLHPQGEATLLVDSAAWSTS